MTRMTRVTPVTPVMSVTPVTPVTPGQGVTGLATHWAGRVPGPKIPFSSIFFLPGDLGFFSRGAQIRERWERLWDRSLVGTGRARHWAGNVPKTPPAATFMVEGAPVIPQPPKIPFPGVKREWQEGLQGWGKGQRGQKREGGHPPLRDSVLGVGTAP